MTKQEVKKLVNNFQYKTLEFNLKFKLGKAYITGYRNLMDPKTGKSDTYEATEVFNYKSANEMQFLLGLRDWIHNAECHEADEYMFYKGKQIFDPHAAKESLY